MARHLDHPNFTHVNINLEDREGIKQLFEKEKPQGVVNLAAQAGVRYSIKIRWPM
jgi:NAD dependent epimerase/dehydratase family.